MKATPDFIISKLNDRKENGSLRLLSPKKSLIDFCSNDYLGFSSSPELKTLVNKELEKFPNYPLGATGSRLISGNDKFTEDLETQLAAFHDSKAGLIFNSGYDANVGLFSSLGQRGDTIITDELIHASIIDGTRLSHANRYIFKHNDLNSLEKKLRVAKGNIFIGIETIYSMDGDEAPLNAILDLADKYNAYVIADEAHATGVFGEKGCGLAQETGVHGRIFARVVTFGKAMGGHGAVVLCDNNLRSYLINFSRSFVYSTAASFYTHLSVKMAYQFMQAGDYQHQMRQKIELFKKHTGAISGKLINSRSAIQCLVIGENHRTKTIALALQNDGFDVRPILSPTVQTGKERLRICLHTFNTDQEIIDLVSSLKKLIWNHYSSPE